MTVTPIGSRAGAPGVNNASTLVVTQHASTQVGDLLLVGVACTGANPTIATPAGWTLLATQGPVESNHVLKVFYREAASTGAATHNFSINDDNTSTADATYVLFTYRGHRALSSGATFVGVGGASDLSNSSAGDRTAGTGSVSPTAAMELAVAFWSVAGTTTGAYSLTPPAGWTAAPVAYTSGSVIEPTMAGAYRALGSGPGSVNMTFTKGSSWTTQNNLAIQVLLAVGNVAPNVATPLTPDGGVTVPFDEPTPCRWRFNDPDPGDYQSKADFRHRIVGAGAWTTVTTAVTLADTYLIPASTYADGDDVEWQVLTYDAAGEPAADWSASAFFTAGTTPSPPTITSHADDDIIGESTDTLVWTGSGDEFQVRKLADVAGSPDTSTVFFDTGWVATAGVLSYPLTFPVNDRTEHLQVRRKVDGLTSAWASVRIEVAYTPPLAPLLTVSVHQVDGVDAALLIEVSNL